MFFKFLFMAPKIRFIDLASIYIPHSVPIQSTMQALVLMTSISGPYLI